MTNKRINELTLLGDIADGDVLVGERVNGTTVRLTYVNPVEDGDKGDITVSASGATWSIDTPSSATVATDDKVLIKDTSASDVMKYVTAQSIANLMTPGGSTTQLQYNNVGAFGGISQLTYNGSNVSLTTGFTIDGTADEIQLRVQGHSSQTSNIFEIENSAATNVFTVSNSGNTYTLGSVTTDSYIDVAEIATPSAPSATYTRIWSESRGGFSTLFWRNGTGPHELSGNSVQVVRNNTGSTITKGKWVYISGSTGVVPTIALARADSLSTVPVMGIVAADISNNSFGHVISFGEASTVDTSTFVDGDILFLSYSSAGDATTTQPTTAGAVIHRIGVVVKGNSAGAGIINVLIGQENSLQLAADSGSNSVINIGDTITIAGGVGIDTSVSGDTITAALDLNELTTEASIDAGDFLTMVDITDDGSGKITLANLKTGLGLTGTNSGDQTSIVGITGTKAEFNTAVSDGDIVYTDALGTGVATFLATPSSANLIAALTDETGTGAAVFANTPTLITPILGTPTSGALTNCTSIPVANATGVLPVANGGTSVAAVPLFSVYTLSTQTIATATYTKVAFNTELADSNSNYDSTTNYRFTPTISGTYGFWVQVGFSTAVDLMEYYITIYKNGAAEVYGPTFHASGTGAHSCTAAFALPANGSTDYFEIYIRQASGGNLDTAGGTASTWFGLRIGA